MDMMAFDDFANVPDVGDTQGLCGKSSGKNQHIVAMYDGRPYGPEESEQPEEGDDSETEIEKDPDRMKVGPVEHSKLDSS